MAYQIADGANFAPEGKKNFVVKPGEFVFAAADLEHGHIYGMVNGLLEAGATLKYVWDDDPAKVTEFVKKHPNVTVVEDFDRILDDPEVKMVAAAGIPNERAAMGIRVMEAGKDYFVDKTPMTELCQVEAVREACKRTGHRYFCYFSERLHSESSLYAGQMIADGAVGKVMQVVGFGPHRHGASRPDWFYRHRQYGGILCDIGSHQIEQFLTFTGNENACVSSARVGNYTYPQYPEFEDFGDAALIGDNGATNYFRVDWHNPDGLRAWGDGRVFIIGTSGYIELRKNINVGTEQTRGNHLFYVDGAKEQYIDTNGTTGYPFFGQMILDCLNGTETAMTQSHILKAAELCIRVQAQAIHVSRDNITAGMFAD